MSKRSMWLKIIGLSCLLTSHVFAGNAVYPELVPVPTGFQPEGVATGKGHVAYVGSLINGGIYQVDLRSGTGDLLVDGEEDKSAVGLAYDERSNYLFVAGGLNGTVTVYDVTDGAEMASYKIGEEGGFINDGIVTKDAAYFTDSFVPVIYRIPLTANGRLPDVADIDVLPLSGDFIQEPGPFVFNANGIEATANGKYLYLVNMVLGALYRVDPQTGEATQVQVTGGSLDNADGILFAHNALYVVQNFINQLAQLELSSDGLSATITEIISHPDFRIPTTAAGFGNAVYVINARFDVAPPPLSDDALAYPDIDFNLVRVGINE